MLHYDARHTIKIEGPLPEGLDVEDLDSRAVEDFYDEMEYRIRLGLSALTDSLAERYFTMKVTVD